MTDHQQIGHHSRAGETALEWLANHVTEIALVASAVCYLFGVLQTQFVLRELRVTMDDLDITTTDILLAAGTSLALAGFVAGASIGLALATSVASDSRETRSARITGACVGLAAAALLGYVVGISLSDSASGRGGALWCGGVFLVSVLVSHFTRFLGCSLPLLLGLVLLGALFGQGTFGGRAWAHAVSDWDGRPIESARTPLWLELLVTPEEGEVWHDGSWSCVLRVSSRVVVAEGRIQVYEEAVRFRPEDCRD